MEVISEGPGKIFFSDIITKVFEFGFLGFAIVYFLFTSIVLRQVNLMTQTIKTEGGGLLKALAIMYCGFSLGVIVLIIGMF